MLTFILATTLLYIQDSVVDMREEATDTSRVASQAVFAEKVEVEKEVEGWSYIKTPDQYLGWVPNQVLVVRDKPYEGDIRVSRLVAHVFGINDTEYGPIITLPYGTKLQSLDSTDARWIKVLLPNSKEGYIQKGDVALESTLSSKDELVSFSQRFLGLPYTWGGRTSFGFDCSGFMQMLYQQIGVDLQRNARLQILDPRFYSIPIESLEVGDLIFFGKSEQKIMHVGMSIGSGQFIHTSPRENKPWLRISHLSDFEWSGHPNAYYPYRTAKQLKE